MVRVRIYASVKEGKLRKALHLAYRYSNPLGKYEIILKHPNMEVRVWADEDWWVDLVADRTCFLMEVIADG